MVGKLRGGQGHRPGDPPPSSSTSGAGWWPWPSCCPWPCSSCAPTWPSIAMSANLRYLSIMALVGVSVMNVLIYKAGQTTESLNMALLVPTHAGDDHHPLAHPLLRAHHMRAGWPGLWWCSRAWCVLISRAQRGAHPERSLRGRRPVGFGGGGLFRGVFALGAQAAHRHLRGGVQRRDLRPGHRVHGPGGVVEMAVMPAPTWNMPVIVGVLYAGVGCSFVAYLFWTRAITAIGPVRSGMVYYSLPLFSRGGLLHHPGRAHHPRPRGGAGGLIIAGILTAPWTGARPPGCASPQRAGPQAHGKGRPEAAFFVGSGSRGWLGFLFHLGLLHGHADALEHEEDAVAVPHGVDARRTPAGRPASRRSWTPARRGRRRSCRRARCALRITWSTALASSRSLPSCCMTFIMGPKAFQMLPRSLRVSTCARASRTRRSCTG